MAEIVAQNVEPQTAEVVLAALKKVEGQLITTRLLDRLPGGRVDWRLSRQLGWSEIKNRAYVNSAGTNREGVCLVIARSEASVPLDTEFVETENAAYFAKRRERNAKRAAALANSALLEKVAFLFNELEDINAARRAKIQEFAVYVEPESPLAPDRFELERCCGIREDKDK